MQTKSKQGRKGQYGEAAKQIYAEAELIAQRLADGQTAKEIAQDYQCSYPSFCRHGPLALGLGRWQRLIRQGTKRGHRAQKPTSMPEVQKPETGKECWYCGKRNPPDTLVCFYCRTLLHG